MKKNKEKTNITTKIICEIGINHNGSIKSCKKLIDQAYKSGSWGIKFQYRNLKNYFDRYKNQTELGKEIIDKELKKNYLSPKNIISLCKYAKKFRLKVGISFFKSEDIKDFKKFSFDFYKIPSAACDNFLLLKNLLKFNKLTLISFGGRSLKSIKIILNNVPKNRISKIVILHCISNYPVSVLNSNLGFIDVLKKNFKNYLIGYSSHEREIYNCIYVLSKKVHFIERHITLNVNSEGLDHSSSSEFNDFKILNYYAKNLDIIDKKKSNREINQGEIINIQNLGSSYYFDRNVPAGTVLKRDFLKLSQPKIGIDDLEINKYLGLKIKKNVKNNTPLTSTLFFNSNLLKKHSLFINQKKISIPVRPHDYNQLSKEIECKFYELHLSYKDVNSFDKGSINKTFIKNNNFSVHAPDYINENYILDLFSKNKNIKRKSYTLLKKCIRICRYLKNICKFDVKLIISISSMPKHTSKEIFYKKVLNLTNQIKKKFKIQILPQWLPVYAWYFGGSKKLDIFSDPNDLNFLNTIGLKICLDTSHFLLSCKYYERKPDKIFFKNTSIFDHYHLSDAKGLDAEGIKLGRGDLLKTNLIKHILNQNSKIVVLETWQGHLKEGEGFKQDIKKLYSKFYEK